MSAGASTEAGAPEATSSHNVFYYRHERDLLDAVVRTIAPTLERGGVALCVLDRPFLPLVRRWRRSQAAAENAPWADRCVVAGATATPWSFTLRRAMHDPRFQKKAQDLVEKLTGRGNGEIAVAAQVASVVRRRSGSARAMQFERQWDSLCKRLDFPLLCLYPIEAMAGVDGPVVSARHDRAWSAQ